MGSKKGILKTAAKKIGLSFEEYQGKINSGLKWCSIGKHFVPVNEFGLNKLKGDGLAPYCRACTHVKVRKCTKGRPSPNKGIPHTIESRMKMSEAHRGSRNHRWKGGVKKEKRDKIKVLASRAVNHEIEAGRLPRPDNLFCFKCGKPAKDYHHHKGYEPEHWLDILPACRPCNKKLD